MAEVAKAYVTLIPSAKGFASGIQREIGGDVEKTSRASGKRAGEVYAKGYLGPLRGVGAAAIALVGIDKIGGLIKDAFSEARESQKVGALTAQVIKTTGGAANVTAKQVGNLSTAISNKTGIDDEAIQSGSNLLLTFKNIRNETGKGNDIFNQATQSITDLGAAMGKDPKSAAIQLGKALNDPVKGITALTRVGVSFDAGQKKQIKSLVAHGKTMQAQKIILKELGSEFGGAAAASSTAGEKMSVAFKNFEENIGTALLPIVDKIETAITTKVIPAVQQFLTQIQNGTGLGGKFASAGKTIARTLQSIAGFIERNNQVIVPLLAAVAGGIVAFKVITTVVRVWAAAQALLNVVLTANPIGIIIIAIAALVAGFIVAYKRSDKFRAVVKTALDAVGTAGKFLWEKALKPAFDGIKTAFGAVGTAAKFMWNKVLKPTFKFITEAFLTVAGVIIHAAADAFGWVPGLGPKLRKAADKFDKFRDQVNAALNGVKDGVNVKVSLEGSSTVIQHLADIKWQIDHIPRSVTIGVNNKLAGQGAAAFRAAGGPVTAGQPYVVGEKRPELFVPNQSGRIIPRVPGSGTTVNINGNVGYSPDELARRIEVKQRDAAAVYQLSGV